MKSSPSDEARGGQRRAWLIVLSLVHLAAAYLCYVIGRFIDGAEYSEYVESARVQAVLAKTAAAVLVLGPFLAWFGRWRLWGGGVAIVVALAVAFVLIGQPNAE